MLLLMVATLTDIAFEGPAIPIPSVSVMLATVDGLAGISDIRVWLQNNMNSHTWVKGLYSVRLILFIDRQLGKEH